VKWTIAIFELNASTGTHKVGSKRQGCGSVLGIRIPDPDPGARKLRNFSGKMYFLVI
jgi:hypothetical protein